MNAAFDTILGLEALCPLVIILVVAFIALYPMAKSRRNTHSFPKSLRGGLSKNNLKEVKDGS